MRREVDEWTYSKCPGRGEEEVLAAVFIRSDVFRLVLLSNLGDPFPVLSTSLCIFSGFKLHKKKCW